MSLTFEINYESSVCTGRAGCQALETSPPRTSGTGMITILTDRCMFLLDLGLQLCRLQTVSFHVTGT